jgi:hypothetical protein
MTAVAAIVYTLWFGPRRRKLRPTTSRIFGPWLSVHRHQSSSQTLNGGT